MPLINCEVYLILTWASTCVITNATGVGRFAISETKLYVPVVALSTQDNVYQVLKEQLTETSINQSQKQLHKTDI